MGEMQRVTIWERCREGSIWVSIQYFGGMIKCNNIRLTMPFPPSSPTPAYLLTHPLLLHVCCSVRVGVSSVTV